MLAFAKSLKMKLGDLAGHRFTRPGGSVQCKSMLVTDTLPSNYVRWFSRGWVPSEQVPKLGKYLQVSGTIANSYQVFIR